jgi:cytochrome c oxidase assembly protein subunit 15
MKHSSADRFSNFCLFLLAYAVVIILWGAWVRISGSGDGCGPHWPLCHGKVFINDDLTSSAKTIIEYLHRLKSGVFGLLVIFLFFYARKVFPAPHKARLFAGMTLFFTITEGLLGAKLVLFSLVGQNDSLHRAITMSLHLMNTFLLLYFLVGSWVLSKFPSDFKIRKPDIKISFIFFTLVILAATGAWAALASTLFPSQSLLDGIKQDFSADSHWLIRLRIIHPVLALSLGLATVMILQSIKDKHSLAKGSLKYLQICICASMLLGASNILAGSFSFLKLLHLLAADLSWIFLVKASLEMNTAETEGLGEFRTRTTEN